MMNLDFLLPVYETYRDKGLEIYAVSLDTDKGVWANAVKNQKLSWVNVCDGLGTASPALTLYNVPHRTQLSRPATRRQIIPTRTS